VPTFRTPTFAVTLPGGDFLDSGSRVDARPAGRRRGEARRVHTPARPAVSLG
jgi:hypothetical protein